MTELIFGIFWLAIVVPMSIIAAMVNPQYLLFFSIFYIVGIILVYKGAKRLLVNRKTEKNGVICYGRIKNISATGNSVNGRSELKANVCFLTSNNEEKSLDEVIGYDYNKYKEGDYLKIKYYENDINIISKVEKSEVPQNVLDLYDNKEEFKSNIISSSSERLQPMDMPENGTGYAWDNNNQNH